MAHRPTHNLAEFQAAMAANLRATRTAVESAQTLGFSAAGITVTLASMRPGMFYKTMPSEKRAGQWQDVYHVPSIVGILYVKFTDDGIKEFKLLSFKQK